jgi:hypothetical protein
MIEECGSLSSSWFSEPPPRPPVVVNLGIGFDGTMTWG